MTRQQTIDAIQALGLRCTFIRETGEFRITPNLGPLPGGRLAQERHRAEVEAKAYYTDDKADALDTARAMVAK